jgi:hypothetical protein
MARPLACSLIGERLIVCPHRPNRSPLLLRPPFATSFICVGVLLVLVAFVALPLAVITPILASIGGGLVGCGIAGFYCSRGKRTGHS